MVSSTESSSGEPLSDEVTWVGAGPNPLESVAAELKAIQTDTRNRMIQQRRAAGWWGRMNLLIGVPAALFSGAAGAIAALTDVSPGWKITVTLLAVVAAGLMSVATTLNASRRAERAAAQQAAYEALERDARVSLEVDLPRLSYQLAREALENLIDRLREIDGIPPRESFYRATISKRQTRSFSSQAEHTDTKSDMRSGGIIGRRGVGDDEVSGGEEMRSVIDHGAGYGGNENTL
jgi:hypothetical protein